MTTGTTVFKETRARNRATDSSVPRARLRPIDAVSLLALALTMVWVTARAARPLNNPDTWFHLRIGREFWGDWSIASPGSLSSFATAPWVPTQWSTQMVAAAMESRFGLPGVAWLFGVLFLLFVVVVYGLSRSQGGVLPATLATGVVLVAAGPSLSARPQVVSLILFAVTVWLWLRAARRGQPPWLLVPMTWAWATAHGLWSAGALLGLVTCFGLLLDRRVTWRKAAVFAAVPTLSVLAACLTPVGPRLLTSQFAVADRTALIGEWGPTSFRAGPSLAAALLVGAVVVLWSRRGRVAWTPLLTLLLGAGWILTVERMVAFGAIAVAPMFVRALAELIDQRPRPARPTMIEWLAVGGGATACVVALALSVSHTAQQPAGVPSRFASTLAQLPAGSAVIVEDYSGAWLEWRFPQLNPVIDGMFDAYTVDHIEQYVAFKRVEPGWTTFVRRSGAPVALLVDGSPVSAAMQSQLGWEAVQRDQNWVLLRAPS